jgi:hypothetical protein
VAADVVDDVEDPFELEHADAARAMATATTTSDVRIRT